MQQPAVEQPQAHYHNPCSKHQVPAQKPPSPLPAPHPIRFGIFYFVICINFKPGSYLHYPPLITWVGIFRLPFSQHQPQTRGSVCSAPPQQHHSLLFFLLVVVMPCRCHDMDFDRHRFNPEKRKVAAAGGGAGRPRAAAARWDYSASWRRQDCSKLLEGFCRKRYKSQLSKLESSRVMDV